MAQYIYKYEVLSEPNNKTFKIENNKSHFISAYGCIFSFSIFLQRLVFCAVS